MPKKRKTSLTKSAEKLTKIAEKRLAAFPDDEQESRVSAFARRKFESDRDDHTKSPETSDTPMSPIVARGR